MNRNQLIRKTLYSAVAAVLGLLAVFGVITAEQTDQWTDTAYAILEIIAPLVGTGSLVLAASKVHPGSDSRVTEEDVRLAASLAEAKKPAQTVYVAHTAQPAHTAQDAPVSEEPVDDAPVDVDVVAEAARAYEQMVARPKGDPNA